MPRTALHEIPHRLLALRHRRAHTAEREAASTSPNMIATSLAPELTATQLSSLARSSGVVDKLPDETRDYYLMAEAATEYHWAALIWPVISGCDFRVCVDLAAGFGRHSAMLLKHAERVYVVDINKGAVEYCRARFAAEPRAVCLQTNGFSLAGIPTATVTFGFSFDAMVHFDSDIVRAYLVEFARVLRPGGRCFLHHSNFTQDPTGAIDRTAHHRNFMSRELFAHYAYKSGLEVIEQRLLDWSEPLLDCLSLLQKPEQARAF